MKIICWFLRYGARKTGLFLILDNFCPFTPLFPLPPNNPENQNFEKMKKTPGDIIILHKCTINDNHMIYGSWDINCNRQIFFVILGHFLPFYPPNSPKNENIKKKKKKRKYLEISSFYTSVPKLMIIGYTVLGIWCVTIVTIVFYFGQFLTFHPLNSPKNKNFKKKKRKKTPGHTSFYASTPKIMIICYTVLEIWCVTDVIVIFHFWLVFALLPPNSLKNENFNKMEKYLEISSFYTSVPKSWSYAILFLRDGTWHI